MTACPIRYQRQVSDRKGKIFYTSITSLSHISKRRGFIAADTHFPVSCSAVTAETSTAGSRGTTEAASQRYGDALAEF